jgi:hypothetical protein
MSSPSEHGKLITAAAKAALLPLGCKQVGRSRTWISDEGFWLIVIEFQPSGWSRGTYLNVGAMWLWIELPGFRFNYGYREGDFIPFETPEQFTPLVEQHAKRATERIRELQAKFQSIEDVKEHVLKHLPNDNRQIYHAIIACGLAGEAERAWALIEEFQLSAANVRYPDPRASLIRELSESLDDTPRFRDAIADVITKCRAAHKLPADRDRVLDQLSRA